MARQVSFRVGPARLYVMPKGIERQGMVEEDAAKWTSKYGSVVSTVWECAVADGMTEVGLTERMVYLRKRSTASGTPPAAGGLHTLRCHVAPGLDCHE